MLSGSVAQAPTALVTLTKRAWFVLVSRFTSEGIPPALRIVVLLAGICAHSPSAPTTLINTYTNKSLKVTKRLFDSSQRNDQLQACQRSAAKEKEKKRGEEKRYFSSCPYKKPVSARRKF